MLCLPGGHEAPGSTQERKQEVQSRSPSQVVPGNAPGKFRRMKACVTCVPTALPPWSKHPSDALATVRWSYCSNLLKLNGGERWMLARVLQALLNIRCSVHSGKRGGIYLGLAQNPGMMAPCFHYSAFFFFLTRASFQFTMYPRMTLNS